MDIRTLRIFIDVAERSSFTKAANALGYSQSTVSFSMSRSISSAIRAMRASV